MKTFYDANNNHGLMILSQDKFLEVDLSRITIVVAILLVDEGQNESEAMAIFKKLIGNDAQNISICGPESARYEDLADDAILDAEDPGKHGIITDHFTCDEMEALATLSMVRTYLEAQGYCVLIKNAQASDAMDKLLERKMRMRGSVSVRVD